MCGRVHEYISFDCDRMCVCGGLLCVHWRVCLVDPEIEYTSV